MLDKLNRQLLLVQEISNIRRNRASMGTMLQDIQEELSIINQVMLKWPGLDIVRQISAEEREWMKNERVLLANREAFLEKQQLKMRTLQTQQQINAESRGEDDAKPFTSIEEARISCELKKMLMLGEI
ncbi:MAG: hypothetical protein LBF34_04175 [Puniceicoccales bacterium]|nr:hypothetical protein [Puniceicoccales bacterium]